MRYLGGVNSIGDGHDGLGSWRKVSAGWMLWIGVLCLCRFCFVRSRGGTGLRDFSKRVEVGFEEDPNTITYAYVPQYFHRVSY